MKKISFVIPAFNEEYSIGQTIDKIPINKLKKQNYDTEVIVVDNNSSDKTASIAKEKGAKVIQELNRGYGNAYIKGLSEVSGDLIVFTDADGSYPLESTQELIKPLADGEVDLVIGSRFLGTIEKGAMSYIRKLGNKILTKQLNVLFSVNLTDIHSGFRAIKYDVLKKLQLEQPGMEFASEIIVKSIKEKFKIVEIPIKYSQRIKGSKSKLRPFRDGWRHFIYLIRAR